MESAPYPSPLVPGGFLVAVEGIDGAGKTTLVKGIAAELSRMGVPHVAGKEPTTGAWGMELRRSAATGRLSPERELELLLLDRREHVTEVIRPTLDRGEFVLLDRYYLSNVAYQGAEGLDVGHILAANEAFAPAPDLIILLDVPPATGLSRIAARGDAPNHFETVANLERCRLIFNGLVRPGLRRVDASKPADVILVEALEHLIAGAADKIRRSLGLSVDAVERVHALTRGAYAAA